MRMNDAFAFHTTSINVHRFLAETLLFCMCYFLSLHFFGDNVDNCFNAQVVLSHMSLSTAADPI